MGYRFRVHAQPLPGLRCIADLVFPRKRLAVFVDGCFWHGCPVHGHIPKTNARYWREKIQRTISRDNRNNRGLEAAGWVVVRVWEHENPVSAAERILSAMSDLEPSQ